MRLDFLRLSALMLLGTSLSLVGCDSGDDGDSSDDGKEEGGLGGLLGKFKGTGNGSGDGSGNGTGDGSGDGSGNGSGDGSGNGDGSGDGSGNGDGSGDGGGNAGGGDSCLAVCASILGCVTQACGDIVPEGVCVQECAGTDTLPISADAGCDVLGEAIGVDDFSSVCGDLTEQSDEGDDGSDGGGGDIPPVTSNNICCQAIACAIEGQDAPDSGLACIQSICGADGSACAACENIDEDTLFQMCFGG